MSDLSDLTFMQPPARQPRRRGLSDKQLAALRRRPKRYIVSDPELRGHYVRVPPEGPMVFAAVARGPYGGKQVWATLGSTAELRIEQARERAREAIRRIKAGQPAFEPPPPKTDSVATVLADWLKRRVHKAGMRRADEYARIIRVYVLPHWADRAFEELRRSDVARLLDFVEDQHGPGQADAVLNVLRMAGNWLRDRSDDYVPPFAGIKSRVPLQHRRRDRVLADDELRRIWTTCDQLDAFGALVKLLLLSGQRLEKVRTLRWADISTDGTWTIPTEKREKGNGGVLQLPQLALDIIRTQPRLARNPYVFAGDEGAPRSFWHAQKLRLDRLSGVSDWRLHDCRRTARSLLSRASVRPDIAERVLGHARPAMEETYDRHAFVAEKGDALRKLAALVEHIVNPPSDNVVPLHEAAVS
jgi:integrase